MYPTPKKHCLATMGCQIIHILLPCSLLATQHTRFCSFRSDSYRYCCSFFWTGLHESIIQESDDSDLAVWLPNPPKESTHKSHSFENRVTWSSYLLLIHYKESAQMKHSPGNRDWSRCSFSEKTVQDIHRKKWNARKIIRIWHLKTKSVLNNKGFETFLKNNIHQYLHYTHYSN